MQIRDLLKGWWFQRDRFLEVGMVTSNQGIQRTPAIVTDIISQSQQNACTMESKQQKSIDAWLGVWQENFLHLRERKWILSHFSSIFNWLVRTTPTLLRPFSKENDHPGFFCSSRLAPSGFCPHLIPKKDPPSTTHLRFFTQMEVTFSVKTATRNKRPSLSHVYGHDPKPLESLKPPNRHVIYLFIFLKKKQTKNPPKKFGWPKGSRSQGSIPQNSMRQKGFNLPVVPVGFLHSDLWIFSLMLRGRKQRLKPWRKMEGPRTDGEKMEGHMGSL